MKEEKNINNYKSTSYQLVDIDKFEKEVDIPDLAENELNIILSIVEINRQIDNSYNLYKVFMFNFENLLKHYDMKLNDTIVKNTNSFVKFSDFHLINALVINFFSSARTLIESLENCTKFYDNKFTTDFKKYTNDIYDSSFYYRFFIELRNCSQHGNLIVSLNDDRFCINLNEIIDVKHIKPNAKRRKEIEKFIEDIRISHLDEPNFTLTSTLQHCMINLLKIYLFYSNNLLGIIKTSNEQFEKLINNKPNIVSKEYIFYKIDSSIHCMAVNGYYETINFIENQIKEVSIELEEQKSQT